MDEVVDVLDRYVLGSDVDPGVVSTSDGDVPINKLVFAASDPAMDMLAAFAQGRLQALFQAWDSKLPAWGAATYIGTVMPHEEWRAIVDSYGGYEHLSLLLSKDGLDAGELKKLRSIRFDLRTAIVDRTHKMNKLMDEHKRKVAEEGLLA